MTTLNPTARDRLDAELRRRSLAFASTPSHRIDDAIDDALSMARELIDAGRCVVVTAPERGIPITYAGDDLGTLVVDPMPDPTSADAWFLRALADLVGAMLHRRSLDPIAADPLTGLAGRPLLMSHLERMLAATARRHDVVAVMRLDLVAFGSVNAVSPLLGDDVLLDVARRMTDAVRPSDLVARLGGDDFAVVVDGLASVGEARQLAERVRDSVRMTVPAGDGTIDVDACIGVAVVDDPDTAAPDLVGMAERALTQAQHGGAGTIAVAGERLATLVAEHVALATRLRDSLANGHVEVHYQPEVDLRSGRPVALQALARWRDGDGLVRAGDFLPTASEAGLSIDVDQAVLDCVVADLRRWRAQRPGHTVVRIPVSAQRLRDPMALYERLRAALGDDVPPGALCLELRCADLAAMGNADGVLDLIRALGVHLAVTDVESTADVMNIELAIGDSITVGSALVESHPLPLAQAVVAAIVTLADARGAIVTAKQVETLEHAEAMAAAGCRQAQGYLFSVPVPAADVVL